MSTVADQSGGFYIDPTIYAGVDNLVRIASEDVFGPVVIIHPFATDAEPPRWRTIRITVWSPESGPLTSRALNVSDQLRVGQVFVVGK